MPNNVSLTEPYMLNCPFRVGDVVRARTRAIAPYPSLGLENRYRQTPPGWIGRIVHIDQVNDGFANAYTFDLQSRHGEVFQLCASVFFDLLRDVIDPYAVDAEHVAPGTQIWLDAVREAVTYGVITREHAESMRPVGNYFSPSHEYWSVLLDSQGRPVQGRPEEVDVLDGRRYLTNNSSWYGHIESFASVPVQVTIPDFQLGDLVRHTTGWSGRITEIERIDGRYTYTIRRKATNTLHLEGANRITLLERGRVRGPESSPNYVGKFANAKI